MIGISWWLSVGMRAVGSSIMLIGLMSWLEGEGFSASSLFTALLLIFVGSYFSTPKPKKVPDEPVDLNDLVPGIDYRLIYKEHDGKLWRYISVYGPDHKRMLAGEVASSQGASSTREIKPGTSEWHEYYDKKGEAAT
jgi:hypothetical protein